MGEQAQCAHLGVVYVPSEQAFRCDGCGTFPMETIHLWAAFESFRGYVRSLKQEQARADDRYLSLAAKLAEAERQRDAEHAIAADALAANEQAKGAWVVLRDIEECFYDWLGGELTRGQFNECMTTMLHAALGYKDSAPDEAAALRVSRWVRTKTTEWGDHAPDRSIVMTLGVDWPPGPTTVMPTADADEMLRLLREEHYCRYLEACPVCAFLKGKG